MHSRDVVASLVSDGVRSVAGKCFEGVGGWGGVGGEAGVSTQTLLINCETDFAWQSQLRYALDLNAATSSGGSSDASNASLLSVLQMTTHLSYGFEYLVSNFKTGFGFTLTPA